MKLKEFLSTKFSIENLKNIFTNFLSLYFPSCHEGDNLVIRSFDFISHLCFGKNIARDIASLSIFMFTIVSLIIKMAGQFDTEMYYFLLSACLAAIPAAAYSLKIEYQNKQLCKAYQMLNLIPHY